MDLDSDFMIKQNTFQSVNSAYLFRFFKLLGFYYLIFKQICRKTHKNPTNLSDFDNNHT